jgi:pyruvate dehydrogenase E1 component
VNWRPAAVRSSYAITTPYRNTIPVTHEARMPGDLFMERRIRSLVRWNAMAMVMRTNLKDSDLGGHISSFASATLYDIGFNYFWQAPTEEHGGDLIFFQGHPRQASTPAPSWKAASAKSR